jgi:hypothetical protein
MLGKKTECEIIAAESLELGPCRLSDLKYIENVSFSRYDTACSHLLEKTAYHTSLKGTVA